MGETTWLAYKPHSVQRETPPERSSISSDCYQADRAAYPELGLKEPGDEQPPGIDESIALFLLGLAPDGGYLAGALLQLSVVSYTTFSPLLADQNMGHCGLKIDLCQRYVSVALSS